MSNILSFGEILWDIFPEYKKPGGSPANLAYHLHVLGNKSNLISKVGKDNNGKELVTFISKKGLNTDFIQTDTKFPTGTVGVKFIEGEPTYTIHHPAAWDFIEMTEQLGSAVQHADAICYASLSQRQDVSRNTLRKILKRGKPGCLKVFDLNLRQPFVDQTSILESIEWADVIKFNEEELATVSSWLNTNDLPRHLLEKNPGKILLVTLGVKGSKMITSSDVFEQEAFPISNLGDLVGVGDAFLACVIHQLLKKTDSNDLLPRANRYASFVASQKGGMPEIPDHIVQYVNSKSG
jgi:fructokinase